MIDAKTFGAELAAIVKGACDPLIARIDAQEKQIEALQRRISQMPVPKDGEPGRDGIDADQTEILFIKGKVEAIEATVMELPGMIEVPEIPDIPAIIAEEVAKAVAKIPTPQNGAPGPKGEPGEKGESGRDGVGLAGAIIGRSGELIITLTNGEAKSLGVVVGKDGEPGAAGENGLGFEDLGFEAKDGRLFAVFRRGDVVKETRIPGISYRGVWKSGDYLMGDCVTYGSNQWIALKDTDGKPGDSKAWQLAARKGRDGRDGKDASQ